MVADRDSVCAAECVVCHALTEKPPKVSRSVVGRTSQAGRDGGVADRGCGWLFIAALAGAAGYDGIDFKGLLGCLGDSLSRTKAGIEK